MTPRLCPVLVLARRVPERVAVSWGVRAITWEMFNNFVHSTSRYLKEIAVRKGQTVILLKETSPSTPIVLLALWRIGARVCLIDPKLPAPEPAALAALVKPDLVTGPASFRKTWPKGCRWADIEQVVAYGYNDGFLGSETSLEPMLDPQAGVLCRVVVKAAAPVLRLLTYDQLQDDPGDLAGLLRALDTGEPLVIS